jgi:membrane associated rhomboid family serine protease
VIATYALSGLLIVLFVLQFAAGIPNSIVGAGLVKPLVADGEWWRLFTACFLHGNIVHLMANLGGLKVFGGIVEMRTSWRHLMVVYLIAGVAGSLMSQVFLDAPSIGASGAVLGLVAFSFVIGYRDKADYQRDLVQDAGRALVLTGLLGLAMYRNIDNAAHAGGVVAGIGLALLLVRESAIKAVPQLAGWTSALVLLATAAGAGTLVVRSHVDAPPRIAQVTDHAPVPEARVALKIWPGLEGVEYAFTNVSKQGITAWEVGFYADDGTRRVGSFGGDVCRPVEERPGWMKPGQTHVESFRRVIGESRHGLSARVDVVLLDGGGFSGSPSRYEAVLAGRRARLSELEATAALLTVAADMSPADAEPLLRRQIDILASTAERTREPLIVTDLLSARRAAETSPDLYVEKVQRLIDQTRRSAEAFRRCDVR